MWYHTWNAHIVLTTLAPHHMCLKVATRLFVMLAHACVQACNTSTLAPRYSNVNDLHIGAALSERRAGP